MSAGPNTAPNELMDDGRLVTTGTACPASIRETRPVRPLVARFGSCWQVPTVERPPAPVPPSATYTSPSLLNAMPRGFNNPVANAVVVGEETLGFLAATASDDGESSVGALRSQAARNNSGA